MESNHLTSGDRELYANNKLSGPMFSSTNQSSKYTEIYRNIPRYTEIYRNIPRVVYRCDVLERRGRVMMMMVVVDVRGRLKGKLKGCCR